MYFKRAHRVETLTQLNIELKTFALTWCANIFVGCSLTPIFFRQITSFSDSLQYTKKKKELYVESFNYFSYTIDPSTVFAAILTGGQTKPGCYATRHIFPFKIRRGSLPSNKYSRFFVGKRLFLEPKFSVNKGETLL